LGGANPPLPGAGPGLTPASADDWASIGSDADRLAGHAKDILDTNFDNGSTAYSTQTNDPYGATTGYGGVGGTGYYPGAGVVPANGVVPNNGIVPNYGAFPPNRLGSKTTVGGSPTSRPSGGSTGSR
jgi:hypothetical protein